MRECKYRLVPAVSVLTCLCAATHPATGASVPSGFSATTVVSTGLSTPTTMAFLAHNDMLVLEKGGSVKRVQLPGPTISTVLTLAVDTNSERGLLGIALHPEFAENSYVYLYYTNSSPLENRISRYTWNGAMLVSPIPIFTLPATPGPNHDGGIILFGPDDKLYAVIGDLNRGDMTENNAGGGMSDTAVVLRINDDGTTPVDNPFTTTGWERFYAYGVRNCFGMAFDPITGDLWDTENGPSNYDEVNRFVPGSNSGWTDIMGPDSRDSQNVSDLVMISGATYVDPAFSWFSTVAPTGIRFLDSCRWSPQIRNQCFVGDANNGNLYKFEPNSNRDGFELTGGLADQVADNGGEVSAAVWGSNFVSITDLQVGKDGNLYVVDIGAGEIVRIRPVFPMGDIDQDGSVTANDEAIFVNLSIGLIEGTPAQIQQSDFDGDGQLSGLDVQCFTTSRLMPN